MFLTPKPSMLSSLKERKEAFVTGHEGTTPLEVFMICVSAPVGLALYRQVVQRFPKTSADDASIGTSSLSSTSVFHVWLECLFFILPMILCQSTWLYPWGLSLVLLEGTAAFTLFALFPMPQQSPAKPSPSVSSASQSLQHKKRRLGFITAYRSSLLFLTFCAILAVDFPLFPRRLAKTEVFGYGLMDLGAASTIVAGGIMASHSSTKPPKIRQWLIFIALGLLRLLTHKNVEYQEHNSEYGLHWNFYFTLSFISISSSTMMMLISTATAFSDKASPFTARRLVSMTPLLLLCLYQAALQFGGLQSYIEHAARTCSLNIGTIKWIDLSSNRSLLLICDLVAANREGIFGCVGYFFLWWTSQQIANDCIPWVPKASPVTDADDDANRTTRFASWLRRGSPMRLGLVSAILWLLHAFLVYALHIPVSRRTTNASFCVWTLAHNFSLLTLFWLVLGEYDEEDGGSVALPPMCAAVNRHGMLIFVVANLLTGLVNLSIPTLDTRNAAALAILLSYLVVVGCLALGLDVLPTLVHRASHQALPKQD